MPIDLGVQGSNPHGGTCYFFFIDIMLVIPHWIWKGIKMQRVAIKAILNEDKGITYTVGSRLSPQNGWMGVGFVIIR